MAREILFRGFHENKNCSTTIYVDGRTVKGKWVEGAYSPYNWTITGKRESKPQIIVFAENENDGLWADVIPSTVGQFTGLDDKNGRKIFEGDTMNATDWAGRERQVSVLGFHNGVCWFGGDGFSDEYIFNTKDREVTGTIFDKEDNCV